MRRREPSAAETSFLTRSARAVAGPVFITALVSSLAAWTFAGCQSGGAHARANAGGNFNGSNQSPESGGFNSGSGSGHGQSFDGAGQGFAGATASGSAGTQFDEMNHAAAAQEQAADADAQHRTELLAAQILDWKSQSDQLSARASADWSSAQAEHARMLAERAGVAQRGQAQIDQMTRIADLTESRADASVRALRAQAQASAERSSAEAAQLEQKIESLKEQSAARLAELTQKSESVTRETAASAKELEARATAQEEQNVGESYRLAIKGAEAEFERAKAEANRLFQAAEALKQTGSNESQKRKMQADRARDLDETDYQASLASIQSFVEHGKADIAVKRVQANTIERNARAEFVKARVEAGARAIVGSAAQQYAMADEQAKALRARAEAEAAQVRAQFSRQATDADAAADEKSPEFTRVTPTAPVIDPEHVAKLKNALAEAQQLRVQADADEMALFGAAGERASAFEAWWQQQQNKHDSSVADADNVGSKFGADAAHQASEAEGRLRTATIRFEQAKAEAEALRQETVASIAAMKAESELILKKGAAVLMQIDAERQATERNSASELRSLTVIAGATRERGEATRTSLTAEADSMERTQSAVVVQMRQEIDGARKVLDSELASLDQGAESYLSVARGSFDEATAMIQTMAQLAEASTVQMVAANQAERLMAQADVDYIKNISNAGRMAAEAAAARAQADTQNDSAHESFDGAASDGNQGFASAPATGNGFFGVMSGSRTSIVDGERQRALVSQYFANQQAAGRATQTLAAAEAYRQRSQQALARLSVRSGAFQNQARDNWASAFSGAAPFPVQETDANRTLVDVPVNSPSNGTDGANAHD